MWLKFWVPVPDESFTNVERKLTGGNADSWVLKEGF